MNVLQPWITELTFMQQTVLLTALRGPDGVRKDHVVKDILKFFRRSVLISALDNLIFTDAYTQGGGNFTGPCKHSGGIKCAVFDFRKNVDDLPHHFLMHLTHGIEILGYKHPHKELREFWNDLYISLCIDLHMHPETEKELDYRLGDNKNRWLASSDTPTGSIEI